MWSGLASLRRWHLACHQNDRKKPARRRSEGRMLQAEAQRLFELKEMTLQKGTGPRGHWAHTTQRVQQRQAIKRSYVTSLVLSFPICIWVESKGIQTC